MAASRPRRITEETESEDSVEPDTIVESMAAAVERVRQMATTVFEGDAALFADPTQESQG